METIQLSKPLLKTQKLRFKDYADRFYQFFASS